MSAEELAILTFGTAAPRELGEERSQAGLAEAFVRHVITHELLAAAVGPDGMRDEALRKARMEELARWTVWPKARYGRRARG